MPFKPYTIALFFKQLKQEGQIPNSCKQNKQADNETTVNINVHIGSQGKRSHGRHML